MAVSDYGWLRALLDAEAALALASAAAGLIPAEAASAIADSCKDSSQFDVQELGERASASGNPVVPLVTALETVVGEQHGRYVHRGATSQDIFDTAAMLVAKRALECIRADVDGVANGASSLAERHLRTPMAGRTLMQQALPTTFGRKAAEWSAGADTMVDRLLAVRDSLPLQLGGAVGTRAAFSGRGSVVAAEMARDLGLVNPVLPWHTMRQPIADLAGALGGLSGVVAKIAGDVVLMAQTEVAEVFECAPGRGGSSTLAHKNNPVAAISARACAMRAPGLVSTLLSGMAQEHERAAGGWHSEWETLSDLLRSTGSATTWLRECLGTLNVDEARMLSNVTMSGPAVSAEGISLHLATTLGRSRAHELVARASTRAATTAEFRQHLLADPVVSEHLTAAGLDELLDPAASLGDAVAQALDTLAAHRARTVIP